MIEMFPLNARNASMAHGEGGTLLCAAVRDGRATGREYHGLFVIHSVIGRVRSLFQTEVSMRISTRISVISMAAAASLRRRNCSASVSST